MRYRIKKLLVIDNCFNHTVIQQSSLHHVVLQPLANSIPGEPSIMRYSPGGCTWRWPNNPWNQALSSLFAWDLCIGWQSLLARITGMSPSLPLSWDQCLWIPHLINKANTNQLKACPSPWRLALCQPEMCDSFPLRWILHLRYCHHIFL